MMDMFKGAKEAVSSFPILIASEESYDDVRHMNL